MERSVPEGRTPFNTFATADTQFLINGIFKKWFLNEISFQSRCWAELIFRSGIQIDHAWLEISSTEVTISA